MKNKKIYIGLGLLSAGILGYFAFKNQKRKQDVSNAESLTIDESDVDKSDINYLSSNGSKSVSVKKYLQYLKVTPSAEKHNQKLMNKQIFSLFDNLNIRNDTSLDSLSKIGVVSKKHTYLGRISGLAEDEIGDLWFVILPNESNFKIKNSFNWGKGINPYRRYVKATAVFANL
jgi:hypothetical protein